MDLFRIGENTFFRFQLRVLAGLKMGFFDFSFLECPQINHLLPSLFSTFQFSNMRAE